MRDPFRWREIFAVSGALTALGCSSGSSSPPADAAQPAFCCEGVSDPCCRLTCAEAGAAAYAACEEAGASCLASGGFFENMGGPAPVCAYFLEAGPEAATGEDGGGDAGDAAAADAPDAVAASDATGGGD